MDEQRYGARQDDVGSAWRSMVVGRADQTTDRFASRPHVRGVELCRFAVRADWYRASGLFSGQCCGIDSSPGGTRGPDIAPRGGSCFQDDVHGRRGGVPRRRPAYQTTSRKREASAQSTATYVMRPTSPSGPAAASSRLVSGQVLPDWSAPSRPGADNATNLDGPFGSFRRDWLDCFCPSLR